MSLSCLSLASTATWPFSLTTGTGPPIEEGAAEGAEADAAAATTAEADADVDVDAAAAAAAAVANPRCIASSADAPRRLAARTRRASMIRLPNKNSNEWKNGEQKERAP